MKVASALLLLLFAPPTVFAADSETEGECVGEVRPADLTPAEIAADVVANADANGDGAISLAEIGNVGLPEKQLP